MDAALVRKILDACYLAKRVTETMPPLPAGLVPRHVHILDAVHRLGMHNEKVHVGDVSAGMNATTPSIARLIAELEKLGYLTKHAETADKRFVSLRLSEKGRDFHALYVEVFHEGLAAALEDLDDEDCRAAITVMQTVHERIRTVTQNFTGKEKK